jgi:hypothetical protein
LEVLTASHRPVEMVRDAFCSCPTVLKSDQGWSVRRGSDHQTLKSDARRLPTRHNILTCRITVRAAALLSLLRARGRCRQWLEFSETRGESNASDWSSPLVRAGTRVSGDEARGRGLQRNNYISPTTCSVFLWRTNK